MSNLIDIGANLTDKAFDADRADVLARAADAGVHRIVLTGTSVTNSRAAAALAAEHPGRLFSTAGVHPHDAKSVDSQTMKALADIAAAPGVVAIGECGLDFNRDFSPRPAQRSAFAAQLELAVERDLPVFVHERDAADDLVAILDDNPALPPIVVHCFTGDGAALDAYIERGFYIGITGWICDERRGLHLHELIGRIPEDRLMIETDAPYLLPRTIRPRPRSRRNEPAFLPHVVTTIAGALNLSEDEVARRTRANAETFFRLPKAVGSGL